LNLLKHYFEILGDKAACYEDLQPYTNLDSDVLADWITFLEGTSHTPVGLSTYTQSSAKPMQTSEMELRRSINAHKLLRYGLSAAQLTMEQERIRATDLVREYFEALPLGRDLPKLELQLSDDLAILAAQVYVNMFALGNAVAHLHNAVVVLEYASRKSPQSYQVHLELVRIYRLLGMFVDSRHILAALDFLLMSGAPQLALDHYRLLNVKQVQNDTMSYLILSRATNFSLAATGDLTYASECLESSHIYFSNSQEVSANPYPYIDYR